MSNVQIVKVTRSKNRNVCKLIKNVATKNEHCFVKFKWTNWVDRIPSCCWRLMLIFRAKINFVLWISMRPQISSTKDYPEPAHAFHSIQFVISRIPKFRPMTCTDLRQVWCPVWSACMGLSLQFNRSVYNFFLWLIPSLLKFRSNMTVEYNLMTRKTLWPVSNNLFVFGKGLNIFSERSRHFLKKFWFSRTSRTLRKQRGTRFVVIGLTRIRYTQQCTDRTIDY